MSEENHLGHRLKNFREARGFTQQMLELAIDAAFGHISRIESGKINPTKETLLRIADVLKLNSKEIALLLNFQTQKVTPREIMAAVNYLSPYFSKAQNPAYLADDMWFMHAWNKKAEELFQIPKAALESLKGIHELGFIFQSEFPIRKNLSQDEWKKLAQAQLRHFMSDLAINNRTEEEWLKELLKDLENFPDFTKMWQEALQSKRAFLSEDERYLQINVNGKKRRFFISILNIDKFPRFNLVEFVVKGRS